ncbi:MAG: hypothetical protein EON58_23320 [Alphaproteobacteria bacterium]|nr:MAG: hypothetical protein EON58_23320 [Alphaproteobacteria bacterium]
MSGNDPVGAYYFSLGINSVVKQVQRLRRGLERYPDILTSHLPAGVGKKVVHCVVNSLPYAVIGGIDGIYFTDESSLMRFFAQSEIGERKFHQSEGIGEIDVRTAVAFLWDGSSPSPEDLLRQFEQPIQAIIAVAHTSLNPTTLPIEEGRACGVFYFTPQDVTPTSIREATRQAGFRSGLDPQQ